MKLDKIVQQDAHDWARAEMFFGEGAGIRRRHLEVQINQKMDSIPGYEERFNAAYALQDMADHAIKAAKERQKIDTLAKAGKNVRALKNGNIRGLSTGVFIVFGVAYVAHTTGYDKVALEESKKLYKKAKVELKFRKARFQGRNVERIV